MDKQPLISIIIPVYKVEQYLRTCLDSVLAQTYKNWEMLLVDDGSPDKCGDICDEYAQSDSRIKVFHKENGGLSSARNYALDNHPEGDFLTFLDSDDFWHHEYLNSLVKLQLDYDADLVQCGHIEGMGNTFPDLPKDAHISTLNNHGVFITEKANITMWGKLFRASILDDVRMPVGLYNEDDWTTWKLYYKCKTIVVTSQCLYYYTQNPSSIMARLGKKPDLRYLDAYNERINFFVQTGEKDLEHCSRLQLLKSIVLTYKNKHLTKDERKYLKETLIESWNELRKSPYIRFIYKVLFAMFIISPTMTSKLASKIKS